MGLKAVGVDLTGLAVLSGAIGVGLGFGLQRVVSNLIPGVIILLDKSIKPGDVIALGDTFGWIGALGARCVSITTRDGREHLIPNEDLITGQVVNWSHSNDFVRLDLRFGASYEDDPHRVRRVAVEAARSVGRVLADRPPVCRVTGFGDSAVDYILRLLDPRPDGRAHRHPRRRAPGAVGRVRGARRLDPLPAARGADPRRSGRRRPIPPPGSRTAPRPRREAAVKPP